MSLFPTLHIHQFDEQGIEHELYVNTFSEHLRKHHAHILHPHRHDFYLAVLFTKGAGFHEIDFQRFPVKAGAVFFMLPGQTHHWEFTEPPEGYIFCHSPAYFYLNFPLQQPSDFPFFFSRRNRPYLQLPMGKINRIADQYEELLLEYESVFSHKYRKLAGLLSNLYIDLSREYAAVHPQRLGDFRQYAAKFRELEALIETHYLSERTVTFYADKLHLSTRHLNRICREVAGKTCIGVITERVILEAKRLLSSEKYNLNEIAQQLGYEEYAYFSRLFRQYCHESPKDFRKRYF